MTRPSPRALLVVLVVLGSLTACGDPKPSRVSLDAGTAASAPATPSPEPTAPPTTAPPVPEPPVPPTATPKPTPTRTKAKPPAPKKVPAQSGGSSIAQAVLDQTNAWRADAGLPPFRMSSGLVASAHKHNLRMAAGCGLSHRCDGEADLGDRIQTEGVGWAGAGENCGQGGADNSTGAIAEAAKGLNQSMFDERPPNDGHRQNLLSSGFDQIGIDVVRDASGTVWLTEDFVSN